MLDFGHDHGTRMEVLKSAFTKHLRQAADWRRGCRNETHVGCNVYCDKAEAKLIMRAGHRFYIKQGGSYFNMLNVHRFPEKKFCVMTVHLKLHYGIIPIVSTRMYYRGSTSGITYIGNNHHVQHRLFLRQSYAFYIPTGIYIFYPCIICLLTNWWTW